MTDFQEQSVEIRQFLLGRLHEKRVEELEELIFREPEFAEEVRIIESELIADYRMGRLNAEELSYFKQKYLTNPAGLRTVQYESALDEFIQTKLEKSEHLSGARLTPATATPSERETNETPLTKEKSKRESWLTRLYSPFTARHALAYSALLASLLLALVLLFLNLRHSSQPIRDDAERRAREEELALLNRDETVASRGKEVATVELKSTQRNESSMPRVNIGGAAQDKLIQLRLNLMRSGPVRYRAVFLDDRRNTLFTIPNLTARDTPSGPQVWLFVPAKYLKRGDYQIDLSSLGRDEAYTEEGAYSFRVVDER